MKGTAAGALFAPVTAVLHHLSAPALCGFMALLAMLVFLCAPALAAPPPAGSFIDNTAYLTSRDHPAPMASNSVRVVVQAANNATITVTKALFPTTDTGTFNLLVGATTVASAVGNGGTGNTTVAANTAVTVSETGAGGTSLANYVTTYSCTGGISGSGTSVSITPTPGQAINCTFTNSRLATVTIVKQSNGSTGSFSFTGGTNGLPATLNLDTGTGNPKSSSAYAVTALNTATAITETVPAGWTLNAAATSCTDGSSTFGALVGGTLTIPAGNIAAGKNITCTFVNDVDCTNSFTLVENRQANALPGAMVTLYHTLTNTCTIASNSYTLTLANLTGDGYDMNSLTLYRNINNTGLLAPTDPVIPPGGSITLNPGESAILAITGVVPTATLPGLTANIQITASTQTTANIRTTATASPQSTAAQGVAANIDTILTLAPVPPTIDYYTDNSYSRKTAVSAIGSPLFVQAIAPQCNADPLTVETKIITVTSALTGDVESYPAVETGPNTGIFRIMPNVPTSNGAINPAVPGNHTVEELKDDIITATIQGCGSASVSTVLYIDPMGVLFDSHSNELIAGAQVTLIDVTGTGNGGSPGAPAKVLALDGVTAAPATVTTGTDGAFQFPLVQPSTYQLKIVPPNGYKFPSVVPQAQLPPKPVRTIDPLGSYGGIFNVSSATGPVRFDVPLDPGQLGGLFIEKAASVAIAEIGDFVDYTVQVKNGTGKSLANVTLTDRLPAGFSYLPGTARLGGKHLSDPAGGHGPLLVFTLGPLDADKTATLTLTYRLKIGPGTFEGISINRAQAAGSNGSVSNVAKALVKVVGGVFSDKGFIIGKVFLDCNRNRIQDPEELGIPGVRLFMEDGTFVTTDSEGKFSLYNISPRTHVLKIDATTLPPGSELISLSNRNAGDAGSLFIDMKNGEMQKANFAEGSCNAEVMKDVKLRRAKGDGANAESARALAKPLAFPIQAMALSDVRGLPSSGIVGDTAPGATQPGATQPGATQPGAAQAGVAQPGKAQAGAGNPAAPPAASDSRKEAAPVDSSTLEDDLAKTDNAVGFLNLKDKDVLAIDQTPILVKGPAGGNLQLLVNGTEVSEKQMGKKIVDSERRIEAREYIAVELKPGVNKLQLFLVDPFGNRRGEKTIQVTAPGKLSKIVISVPKKEFSADGHTNLPVTVRLFDENGLPFAAKTVVTLESSIGQWQTTDIDVKEPGMQVIVKGGSAEFPLRPPTEPGEALIKVSGGAVKADTKVYFYPHLRPMIAAGLVEGTINLRNLSSGSIVPARNQDGFEQQLQSFSFSGDNGKVDGGARAALFLKGKVMGDCLLTLGYDSDKDTREALFRDIQPDQFYPVYGDSAVKGFDAQSTGKLYVRVDKNKSYLLYGDFTTPDTKDVRVLGAYTRSLNGLRGHYEDSKVSANVFASRDSSQQTIDEIPAQGISGPYSLSKPGFIANSETITIITRDRNQPTLVLKTVPQTRFTDYEIDNISGSILFKAPVPTLDPNLNPNYIRVSYESDQGGDKFWVAGGDAQVKLTKNLEVGGSYVRDENPANKFEMMSANTTIKLFEKTYLIGEWAQAALEGSGRGGAERFEFRHDGDKLQVKIYGVMTDRSFANPNSTFQQGRKEAGAKATYKATPSTTITAEALHSEDTKTSGITDGMMLNLQQTVAKWLKAELGLRYSHVSTAPSQPGGVTTATPTDVTSLRAKLTGQIPQFPKLSLTGEFEQSLAYSDRRIAAGGFEYQMSTAGKLYARHEFISSLTGPYNLNSTQQQNTTQVGVDSEYMKDGKVFSEYRVRDAVEGREAEAAIGLKNSWQIAKGIKLNTTLERIQKLDGTTDNTATAVTGALEYTASPLWKGTARLEYRASTTSNAFLNTFGVAFKLNRNITLLGKQFLSYTDNKGQSPDVVQERLQAGFAYRPTDTDTWNVLSRYEFKYEKNGAIASAGVMPDTAVDRKAHIFSTHFNYQPTNYLTTSARYAAKLVTEESNGLSASTSASHMLSGRTIYDLTSKWDAGLNYSALCSIDFRSCRYGVGGEVGRLVATNLWLSAGYNIFGFNDKDLGAEEYTTQGIYFRLRFKFDEDLFSGKDPKVNRTLIVNEAGTDKK